MLALHAIPPSAGQAPACQRRPARPSNAITQRSNSPRLISCVEHRALGRRAPTTADDSAREPSLRYHPAGRRTSSQQSIRRLRKRHRCVRVVEPVAMVPLWGACARRFRNRHFFERLPLYIARGFPRRDARTENDPFPDGRSPVVELGTSATGSASRVERRRFRVRRVDRRRGASATAAPALGLGKFSPGGDGADGAPPHAPIPV